ncbi:RluA family pseudouridine synthase [Brasilonema octagenarum UFV-E1]|uniref:RNA pseudouridylate synthase n=1 Tax=Brasilonema sennae CENA114 TaxID=415709 RepID=A0A856MDH6_9CYAN|nr:RluA family pseudouridine synthase [Brasilonema sennae]QDL09233.1 RluA family pseudouridine synthase [Brasilonema sennae CENA114]QDL15592.1 RluA family pseudouridine synthase [Brasilonema octagenarum UFV-E1]
MMVLHPLSDFINFNSPVSNSSPNYWYEGRCPQTSELLRLPRTPLIEAIAYNLMQHLATDNRYSSEGKMYGVLLIELPNGEQKILKAFSGLLNGDSVVEGWVPPIPGRKQVALEEASTLSELDAIKQELITLKQLPERLQYETHTSEFELRLQQMSDRHQDCKNKRIKKRQILCETLAGETLHFALEQLNEESRREGIERKQLKRQRDEKLQPLQQLIATADTRIRELKQQRKQLSRQLQAQMHAAYTLMNFLGQSLTLQQLIPGGMPTGTGDCCAPKLLHYAATHHFKPLAMAEFWWGSSSTDQDKVQGEFYGACVERCQPLMGFLLSGLSQRKSNADVSTTEQTSPSLESALKSFPLLYKERDARQGRVRLGESFESFDDLCVHPSLDKGRGDYDRVECFYNGQLLGFDILYEDEWLIVVNKPSGLLSVPGRYFDTQDSVLSRLRYLLPDRVILNAVHRLDQETSGILVLARNQQIYRQLSQQFQQRQVHKVYEAVLSGSLTTEQGVIELPLWGNPENRPYQQVDWQYGKPSVTHFQMIAVEGNYTRVELTPLTGRTHQLRVHAADVKGLGVPILGDRLYGCGAAASRLHLHARELCFEHPQLGKTIHLQAKTPF